MSQLTAGQCNVVDFGARHRLGIIDLTNRSDRTFPQTIADFAHHIRDRACLAPVARAIAIDHGQSAGEHTAHCRPSAYLH
jgi:hypothetical protein